ncbi:hypothetical protein B484DRAFT_432989, partial [Ochromonadaceae sp. CCMP2298]
MPSLSNYLGLLLLVLLPLISAFHSGAFRSDVWVQDKPVHPDEQVTFLVAMELPDVPAMHQALLRVSDPTHAEYGRYLSHQQMQQFAPPLAARSLVRDFFQSIEGAKLPKPHLEAPLSDLFEVSAPAGAICKALQTSLAWVKAGGKTERRAVRAVGGMILPPHITSLLSFVSLNAPVSHMGPVTKSEHSHTPQYHSHTHTHTHTPPTDTQPHDSHNAHETHTDTHTEHSRRISEAAEAAEQRQQGQQGQQGVSLAMGAQLAAAAAGADFAQLQALSGFVGLRVGNEETLVLFQPHCRSPYQKDKEDKKGDTEEGGQEGQDKPEKWQARTVVLPREAAYCFNFHTTQTCAGAEGINCTCIVKIT